MGLLNIKAVLKVDRIVRKFQDIARHQGGTEDYLMHAFQSALRA